MPLLSAVLFKAGGSATQHCAVIVVHDTLLAFGMCVQVMATKRCGAYRPPPHGHVAWKRNSHQKKSGYYEPLLKRFFLFFGTVNSGYSDVPPGKKKSSGVKYVVIHQVLLLLVIQVVIIPDGFCVAVNGERFWARKQRRYTPCCYIRYIIFLYDTHLSAKTGRFRKGLLESHVTSHQTSLHVRHMKYWPSTSEYKGNTSQYLPERRSRGRRYQQDTAWRTDEYEVSISFNVYTSVWSTRTRVHILDSTHGCLAYSSFYLTLAWSVWKWLRNWRYYAELALCT